MDKGRVIAKIKTTWGDTLVGEMCVHLADAILSLKPQEARMLTYENLLQLSGQGELTPEFRAAVTVLTSSEAAILKAGGVFIDDDDNSAELSDEDFAEVVAQNTLVHPVTGSPVDNPREHVLPFFALVADAENGH